MISQHIAATHAWQAAFILFTTVTCVSIPEPIHAADGSRDSAIGPQLPGSEESPSKEDPDQASTENQQPAGPLKTAAITVFDDVKYLVTAPLRMDLQSALITAGVAGAVGTVMVFDGDIRTWVQDNRTTKGDEIFDKISKVGNAIGPAVIGLAAGGYVFRSNEAGNKLLQTSLVSLEAQGLAVGITQLTKIVVGRRRPSEDPQGNSYQPGVAGSSFPSGSSTNAFAFAAVFSEQYPLPVQILLYSLALAVGAQRVYDDHHFAGDVLAGAVVGYVVGKALVWRHTQGDKGLIFLPMALNGGGGVTMSYRF